MASQLQNPYPEYFDRLTDYSNYNHIIYNLNFNQNIIYNEITNIINNNNILNEDINNNNIIDSAIYNNIFTITAFFDNIDANEYDNNNNLQGQNLFQLVPIESNELSQMIEEDAQCSICLEQYTLEQDEHSNVCKFGCSHYFHIGCLEIWFNINNTCPLCRNQL